MIAKVDSKKFVPFDLVLTVESREEAQALYAVFNHSDNADLIGWGAGKNIQEVLGEEYYIDKRDMVIAGGITYEEFYRGKSVDLSK